jgi:hypothetical protein
VKTLSVRKLCFPAIVLFIIALASPMFGEEGDPPERVARLSYINGNVSFQPSGEDQWSQATLNYPLTTGDRIFTDQDSRAELETGNIAVRLSSNTDLTTTTLNDQLVQIGVAQGTLRVRAYEMREGNSVEIDTPTAALTILRPGSYRVEIYPDEATTLVTVNSGDLEINGNGFSQTVHSGQTVKLTGTDNDVQLDSVSASQPDDFDNWCGDRDRRFLSSRSRDYVGNYVPGYSDLDEYGNWESVPEYGQIWFPHGVVVGWVPYRYGHWAWVEPWGWTWVEDEPWGFAPFHYGRWVAIGPRWGWIPGPVVVRPVYAPALVAFVGGGGVSIGVGVQCWFPLGPRDPYFPPYHHSDVYLRQVNVTNVTVRNVTVVNNYINVRNVNEVHYAYQRTATTAVSTEAFRTSQPVGRQVVRVNVDEVARAQVIAHPEVVPDRRAISAGAPIAHPPVERTRPVVEHRPLNPGNQQQGGRFTPDRGTFGRPGGANPPTGQTQQGGEDGTLHGVGDQRTVKAPPPTPNPSQDQHGRAVTPDRGTYNRSGGNPPPNSTPAVQNQSGAEDRTFHGPDDRRTVTNPANGAQGNSGPQGVQGNSGGENKPQFAGPPPQRPLVTNAPPPPRNPAFTQRAPVMQDHPGRPLEPAQMNNLRQGQPAGPSRDHEYAPHQHDSTPPKSNQHSDDHSKKGH